MRRLRKLGMFCLELLICGLAFVDVLYGRYEVLRPTRYLKRQACFKPSVTALRSCENAMRYKTALGALAK